MLTLLMRHGEAVDLDEAEDDDQRWLTPNGRRTVKDVATMLADHLRDRGAGLGRILTSPRVRAVQTAELVAAVVGGEASVFVAPELARGTTATALRPLEDLVEEDVVLLVGHMPLIASMASQLAGIEVGGFRTAMVRAFDLDGPGARLLWTLDPYTDNG